MVVHQEIEYVTTVLFKGLGSSKATLHIFVILLIYAILSIFLFIKES